MPALAPGLGGGQTQGQQLSLGPALSSREAEPFQPLRLLLRWAGHRVSPSGQGSEQQVLVVLCWCCSREPPSWGLGLWEWLL